jgi:hypothetical protein
MGRIITSARGIKGDGVNKIIPSSSTALKPHLNRL